MAEDRDWLVTLVMDGAGDWDGSCETVSAPSPEVAITALNNAWGSMLVAGEVYAVAERKSVNNFGTAHGFVVQDDLSIDEWDNTD